MFTTDTRTETFLTQMGVEHSYGNGLAFPDLLPTWKTINLARPSPIRDDAVLEYASLMEGGSPAPAPILHATAGKHAVLDGVQRLAAAELRGFTRFSAYIVRCDCEDTLMAIRVLANARLQGHPEPPEWTRRRAVEVLVIQQGMSAKEVAAMGGWREADIMRLVTVLDWGLRIRTIGGPQQLPDNLIATVAQYTTKEELERARKPIAAFLDTLKKARFSNSEATPYIEEFFRPITKASARVEKYEERLAAMLDEPEILVRINGRRCTSLPKHVLLRRELRAAETTAKEIAENDEELPYADEFFRLLGAIEKQLRSMTNHPKAKTAPTPADMWSEKT